MNDAVTVARGRRAESEWAELDAAFVKVEEALLSELSKTPVGQDAKVLKLHMAVQNLDAVRTAIRRVIDDGLIAQAAISQAGLTRPY